MSRGPYDLTQLRDHARERAIWQPGDMRIPCKERTPLGHSKAPDHANCGGGWCGCLCHEPTASERHLWQQIADELDAYLSPDDSQETLL